MDTIPKTKYPGFSLIWSIENFSYCLEKEGEVLHSPAFATDTSDNIIWKLALCPRGDTDSDENYIGYFLERQLDLGPEWVTLDYEFIVYGCDGLEVKEPIHATFRKGIGFGGHKSFLTRDQVYGRYGPSFLFHDTLTLSCRIWRSSAEISERIQCFARTRMRVEQITYIWTLDNFSYFQENQKKTVQIESVSENNPTVIINFYHSGPFSEERIETEIIQNFYQKIIFYTCRISLLDVEGNVTEFEQKEHWFEGYEEKTWYLLPFISKSSLMANKSRYLLNDTLSLRFDFAFCSGMKSNEIECTNYGPLVSQISDAVFKEMEGKIKRFDTRTEILDLSESLKEDLQCLYSEKKFTDASLQTANTSFPVHKAILCARSSLFCEIFERRLKENITGVVEIEDLEDDTMQRMLLFVYTDRVKELEWEEAAKLYFAAVKYGISSLKEKCSHLLKSKLSASNVCEVLSLADMYQDADIKLAAQNFIFSHGSELICSDMWTMFMSEKVHLAAATMQLYIRQL